MRNDARLAVEAFAELWIAGNFTRENFDRDRAIEARVAGLVNLAHSTRAERA